MELILENLPWLKIRLGGVEAWLWIALPVLFVGCYLLARLTICAVLPKEENQRWVSRYIAAIIRPVSLLIAVLVIGTVQSGLPLSGAAKTMLAYFQSTVSVGALAWIFFVYINDGTDVLYARLTLEGRASAAALMPLLRKIAKISVVLLAFLFLLQNLGFDVAALITALGVGGIALALASQKSVENLFGGIMISLDQPVRVGDLGKFGGIMGTVEDIGIRSTRIRTADRTILSIPNSEMATMQIENFTARDKILFRKNIMLAHDTTPERMRDIVITLKAMLAAHPMVYNDPARASFIEFGNLGVNLEIFAFVKTRDIDKFVDIQEDLLLRIKEIVGTALADPLRFPYKAQAIAS